MAMALYEPGLGYYTNALQKFGAMPSSGSDFVTAPGMSPLFGQTLAVQVKEALAATGSDEVWEFGAGTGALALQLLDSLGDAVARYTIIDLSGTLRARQADTLFKHADKVRWLDAWPEAIEGVVVGNEVLDAMPVQLLQRTQGIWHERGVVSAGEAFAWQDRITDWRPPIEIDGEHDYLTEIHPQAEAFVTSLAERLLAGAGWSSVFLGLRFPRGRVLSPAAPHGHRHVPPAPPGRRQPLGGGRPKRHHRTRQFHGCGHGWAKRRFKCAGIYQPSLVFVESGIGRAHGRGQLG